MVKPDAVSKSASTKLSVAPQNRKGRQPNTESSIQHRDTIINPSRAKMLVFSGFLYTQRMPSPRQMIAEITKASRVFRMAA